MQPRYRTVSVLLLGAAVLASRVNAQDRSGHKTEVQRAGVNGMGSPKCVYCPAPEYSDEARAAKYSGSVLLDVTVTATGKVVDPIVLRSPGLGLDKRALQRVAKWEMKAAVGPTGKPSDCRVQIEMNFHP
jgi:periplasmic protein TonB